MSDNKKKTIVKVVTVVNATLLFFLLLILSFQFISINNLRSNQKSLQAKLNELEQAAIFYENENAYLQTDEFVEDYSRVVLGYGRPGETRFR